MDMSWLDTPAATPAGTPKMGGTAPALPPKPPPLADMHGGGSASEEVEMNMTNLRAMMQSLLAPVNQSLATVGAQVMQLDANVRSVYDELQAQKKITDMHRLSA